MNESALPGPIPIFPLAQRRVTPPSAQTEMSAANQSDAHHFAQTTHQSAYPAGASTSELPTRSRSPSRSPPASETTAHDGEHPALAQKQEHHSDEGSSKSDDPPKYAYGFWSPEIADARKQYIKMSILSCLLIIVALLGVLSIYWGALWKSSELVHNLHGYIVDFDGGEIGTCELILH